MSTNDPTRPTLPLGWRWDGPTHSPELRDPEGTTRAAITGAAWYVHADDRHGAARGTALPAEDETETDAAKREAEAELRRRGAFGAAAPTPILLAAALAWYEAQRWDERPLQGASPATYDLVMAIRAERARVVPSVAPEMCAACGEKPAAICDLCAGCEERQHSIRGEWDGATLERLRAERSEG